MRRPATGAERRKQQSTGPGQPRLPGLVSVKRERKDHVTMYSKLRSFITVGTLSFLFLAGVTAIASGGEAGIAVIDGEVVSYDDFERLAYTEARQRFYHTGPTDEATYLAFRREVAGILVDRRLKVREAAKLGLKPDAGWVDLQLAGYEAQYGDTERWETEGEEMLERLRSHFEEESLLTQIDARLRQVPAPTDEELGAFYAANLDKFTEPEQVRLSIILLAVPAWADGATWDAARAEAAAIAQRIRDGQPFAEAARMHSADPSAANGGDMGFVHSGVLQGEMLQVVNELGDGEMAADPITVLEGVVLVQVEERRAPQVHALEAVRDRATGLWRREAEQAAYDVAVARLRAASKIELDEEYLGRLPD